MPAEKFIIGTAPILTTYPRTMGGGNYNDSDSREWAAAAPVDVGTAYVQIYTPASSPTTVDTWASATISTISTTLASSASEGARTLTLSASATMYRGTLYSIRTVAGEIHTVESARNITGTTVYLKDPLTHDVPSGSDFVGIDIYKVLTTAQTALAGPCHAIWKCVVNGIDMRWSTQFSIVRRLATSKLTPSRLIRDYPIVLSSVDASDYDLEHALGAGWRNEVLPWLHANNISEENIVSVEELEPLHALATVVAILRQRPDTEQVYFDRMQGRLDQLKETTLASSTWFEANQNTDPPGLGPSTNEVVKQGNGFRVSR